MGGDEGRNRSVRQLRARVDHCVLPLMGLSSTGSEHRGAFMLPTHSAQARTAAMRYDQSDMPIPATGEDQSHRASSCGTAIGHGDASTAYGALRETCVHSDVPSERSRFIPA